MIVKFINSFYGKFGDLQWQRRHCAGFDSCSIRQNRPNSSASRSTCTQLGTWWCHGVNLYVGLSTRQRQSSDSSSLDTRTMHRAWPLHTCPFRSLSPAKTAPWPDSHFHLRNVLNRTAWLNMLLPFIIVQKPINIIKHRASTLDMVNTLFVYVPTFVDRQLI